MLSKLNVQLRTLTLPQLGDVTWEAKTPRNACEMEAQLMLLQNRLQKYQGSPASSINEQVRQLTKGAQQIAYNMVLVQEEIGQL